uniref:Uncharacterized protein n=1 Tax=Timema bartmani TaxID=61472 RepID=A0A7R9F4I4_9NEOP|nr:unnamed protein product [Timema bartmani]
MTPGHGNRTRDLWLSTPMPMHWRTKPEVPGSIPVSSRIVARLFKTLKRILWQTSNDNSQSEKAGCRDAWRGGGWVEGGGSPFLAARRLGRLRTGLPPQCIAGFSSRHSVTSLHRLGFRQGPGLLSHDKEQTRNYHPLIQTLNRDYIPIHHHQNAFLKEVYSHSHGYSVVINLGKIPQYTRLGSNPNLPVIGSLVYCESDA